MSEYIIWMRCFSIDIDGSYFSDITQGRNMTLAMLPGQQGVQRCVLNVIYLMTALSSSLNNSEARPNLTQCTKRAGVGWKVTGDLGWILGLNLVLLGPVLFYYSLAK